MSVLIAAVTAVIASNIVFTRAFGVSMTLTAASNPKKLIGICAAVTWFCVASSAGIWAVAHFAGIGIEKAYVPMLYVTVIGAIYSLTLYLSAAFLKKRFKGMKKYIHMAAFNSLVMGTAYLSSGKETLAEHLGFGLSAGLGFTFAAVMLSAVNTKLRSDDVPAAFRGYPAMMIFIGVISMAMLGILGFVPSYM
ncbi:MAG: hypothetical protein ILP19_02845 [Oscillospiraceae bacterium]|nr:hypothetical protein [Oscillospiraceae bacterium]